MQPLGGGHCAVESPAGEHVGRAAKVLKILAGDAPASADMHTRAEELSKPQTEATPTSKSMPRLRAALLKMEEPGGSVEGTQREVRLPRRRSRVRHQKHRDQKKVGSVARRSKKVSCPGALDPAGAPSGLTGKQGTQMKATLAAPSQDSGCSFSSSVSFLRCICLFVHSFIGKVER